MKRSLTPVSLIFQIILLAIASQLSRGQETLKAEFNEINATPAELLRQRGYTAEEHFVTTEDGYIISVVRGRNPLTSNRNSSKVPILFIHGVIENANCFIANSIGAEPRDYTNYDASTMSLEELNDLLLGDPGSKSLPLLSMNFGYEIWLMSRRGTLQSQGHVNSAQQPYLNSEAFTNITPSASLASAFGLGIPHQQLLYLEHPENIVNPRFWNYSYDEEAKYDVPAVMDYVLNESGASKLNLVGHSAGGALILMALTNEPERAEKVSGALLWAPALYMGNSSYAFPRILIALEPFLRNYIGDFPPSVITPAIQTILADFCSIPAFEPICAAIQDYILGAGGGQQDYSGGFLGAIINPISTHDAVSLVQATRKLRMHHYDYVNPIRNMIAYGQPTSPIYNISRIILEGMSLWAGNEDKLVTPADVTSVRDDLAVPVDFHVVGGDAGLFFNHFSFFLHKDVARLAAIPGLEYFESR